MTNQIQESDSTRPFAPTTDYRYLLSPEALAGLLEWEAKRESIDRRAECEAERMVKVRVKR